MGAKGRPFRTQQSDRWGINVEAHPTEPQRWHWVIHLNGDHLCSGGCFQSVRAAKLVAAGSLRVRKAIYYGQHGKPAKEGR